MQPIPPNDLSIRQFAMTKSHRSDADDAIHTIQCSNDTGGKKEKKKKKSRSGLKALCNLFGLGRRELSPKDLIPESTGDAEPILVILVMVLEVVGLELFVKGRQAEIFGIVSDSDCA